MLALRLLPHRSIPLRHSTLLALKHPKSQCLPKLSRSWPRTYSTPTLTHEPDTKPFYITTPIFYPNAVPHIGHLYTLVIGDIIARYQRLIEPGREVKLLVGTDEHGMKIQQAAARAAAAQGKEEPDVLAFCNELSEVFKNLSKKANVSYTMFARTTQGYHKEAVEHVWHTLYEKGYIYKGEYEGWYSITDECFYTAAQVTEAPPPSSSSSSIEEPIYISKETGSKVEWSKEHNYMFRLSAFREPLVQRYSSSPIVTPAQYNSVVLQMLGAGASTGDADAPLLADISISRPRSRLTWGIPVPNDPEHTVYVWFDALLIYMSGVGYPWLPTPSSSFSSTSSTVEGLTPSGWPPNLQIIGKDILRFHAIYLPAILMALNAPSYSFLTSQNYPTSALIEKAVPLPKKLLAHAHWTVSQQKMSKSVGNVVDPMQSVDEYGLDVVRFYLARVGGRFRDDVDWSFEQLEKHSKELQSLLGNYLLRITSPRISASAAAGYQELQSNSGTRQGYLSPLNEELKGEVEKLPHRVKECMDNLEVADALVVVLDVLKLANKVVTDIAPWAKTCPPSLVYETRVTALETLRVCGVCLEPFVPQTSARLLDALGVEGEGRRFESVVGPSTSEGNGSRERWQEREVKSVKLF